VQVAAVKEGRVLLAVRKQLVEAPAGEVVHSLPFRDEAHRIAAVATRSGRYFAIDHDTGTILGGPSVSRLAVLVATDHKLSYLDASKLTGQVVASGDDGAVLLVEPSRRALSIGARRDGTVHAVFSGDGRCVLEAFDPDDPRHANGELVVTDLFTRVRRTVVSSAQMRFTAVGGAECDGDLYAGTNDGKLLKFRRDKDATRLAEQVDVGRGPVQNVLLDARRHRVDTATGRGTVKSFEQRSPSRSVWTLEPSKLATGLVELTESEDGAWLAVSYNTGGAWILDAASGRRVALIRPDAGPLASSAITDSGKVVVGSGAEVIELTMPDFLRRPGMRAFTMCGAFQAMAAIRGELWPSIAQRARLEAAGLSLEGCVGPVGKLAKGG
jgi:hypothetical protein